MWIMCSTKEGKHRLVLLFSIKHQISKANRPLAKKQNKTKQNKTEGKSQFSQSIITSQDINFGLKLKELKTVFVAYTNAFLKKITFYLTKIYILF